MLIAVLRAILRYMGPGNKETGINWYDIYRMVIYCKNNQDVIWPYAVDGNINIFTEIELNIRVFKPAPRFEFYAPCDPFWFFLVYFRMLCSEYLMPVHIFAPSDAWRHQATARTSDYLSSVRSIDVHSKVTLTLFDG